MRLVSYLFFISLTLVLFSSCGNETEDFDQSKLGLEYFPLEIGKYVDYSIDSVVYNFQTGSIDSSSSLLREITIGKFEDINGDTIYEIERLIRKDTTEAWKTNRVWASSRTNVQAVRVEDNLRFIKMTFPADPGKNWEGNIHIPNNTRINIGGELIEVYKNWGNYRIESIDENVNINGVDISKLLSIEQANDENALELRYSIEKYGIGVGLVEKQMMILDTQCIVDCEGQSWEMKAEKGFILNQIIIGHN